MRTSGVRWIATGGALVVLLTGCAPSASDRDPASLVGDTLETAMQEFPSPNVIDLSDPILGQPATFDENGDGSSWIVIVGCYAPNPQGTRDFGVIPSTAVTASIRAAAKRGEFDRYVGSCRR